MLSPKEEKMLDALSRRIAVLRKAKGFTQERLASESSMDRVALANIETGKRRPTVTTILRLAIALGVEPKEFFDKL